MAKKRHVTYTRLTGKHKKQYLNDKSITIKPSEHNDESNEIAEVEFTAKKHMNKFHRNLKNGKGTRINPHELVDIKLHDGKGFFDSIKRGFQKAGDTIKNTANNVGDAAKKTFTTDNLVKGLKAAAPTVAGGVAGAAATAMFPETGPVAGIVAGSATKYAVQRAIDGKGIIGDSFRRIKRVGKKALNFATPIIADALSNSVGTAIEASTGNALAGHIAKEASRRTINNLGNHLSRDGNSKAIDYPQSFNNIKDKAINNVRRQADDQYVRTRSRLPSRLTSDSYTGSGVARTKGCRSNVVLGGSFAPLGGSIRKSKKGGAVKAIEDLQQFSGISGAPGLNALNPNQARMAHIRSFIGQNRLS